MTRHAGLRRDDDVVADLDVVADPDLPAESCCARPFELPAIPTWATRMAFSPTSTLCATMTRLSIFVPRRMIVSPSAARSIGRFGADLDVVLDDDRAHLGDLDVGAVRVP